MTIEHIDFQGMPAVRLVAPDGASAIVLLHGAQLVSWMPAGGDERLFLSGRSRYGDGAAIRGGIPVIFPQFSERGPLPRHGFVRTRPWRLLHTETGVADAMAVLQIGDDEHTRAVWPFSFALELTVGVRAERLDVELAATNTGTTSFEFMAALHTYLRVNEIEEARLGGLHGCRYEDAVGSTAKVETAEELRVEAETDRIYFDAGSPLLLGEGHRRLRIEATGFPDVVVWNPWQQRTAEMPDLAPDDFRRFLCVEAALIGRPLCLVAGAEWFGRQSLSAT